MPKAYVYSTGTRPHDFKVKPPSRATQEKPMYFPRARLTASVRHKKLSPITISTPKQITPKPDLCANGNTQKPLAPLPNMRQRRLDEASRRRKPLLRKEIDRLTRKWSNDHTSQ